MRRILTWEPVQYDLPLWIPLVTVTTQPPGKPSTWGLSTHVTKEAQALGTAWAGGVDRMSLMSISCCPWADSVLRGQHHPSMYGCQWLFTGQGWDTQVPQCTVLPIIEHGMSPEHTSQRQRSSFNRSDCHTTPGPLEPQDIHFPEASQGQEMVVCLLSMPQASCQV